MTELKPCPFPGGESEEVQSEWLGLKHHTINFELGNKKNSKRHIFLQVTGSAKTFEEAKRIAYELWNTRYYPADVQQAIERMEPREIVKTNFGTFDLVSCSGCGHVVSINAKFCSKCGQKLDWSE